MPVSQPSTCAFFYFPKCYDKRKGRITYCIAQHRFAECDLLLHSTVSAYRLLVRVPPFRNSTLMLLQGRKFGAGILGNALGTRGHIERKIMIYCKKHMEVDTIMVLPAAFLHIANQLTYSRSFSKVITSPSLYVIPLISNRRSIQSALKKSPKMRLRRFLGVCLA